MKKDKMSKEKKSNIYLNVTLNITKQFKKNTICNITSFKFFYSKSQ